MKRFKTKEQVFRYIVQKFLKNSKLTLVRGSTARSPIKNYSDLDIEIYGKRAKPYYEMGFVNKKLVLLSVYFYDFVEGKVIKAPKNVKVLYGRYNDSIKPDFSGDKYTSKEKIIREAQLAVDFLFKYLRRKDKLYLKFVDKRLR
ncbi:MAG: hypothetical protein Q8L27_02950 [archaeon]|nr:hypothetical protein [archaeon]